MKSKILLAIFAGALLTSGAAFAQQMTADDLRWVNQCIRDSAGRSAPSQEIVRKYCICMNEKMGDNETRSISQWEQANPNAMADCDRVSGWK